MRDIYTITIQNDIDAEQISTHENVEGGTINGGIEITRDGNFILQIVNLGTEDENGDLHIEGYQSGRYYRDEKDSAHGEDFDTTEADVLATIKAFLA